MRLIIKERQLLTLVILLFLCSLLVMTGCSKGKKKTVMPGEEWVEDLRARIGKHISDPGKKRLLMDLVDQDIKIFNELSQETEKYNKELFAVDKNYNSTPEDFKKVFSGFNETRYRLRAQSLEIRFKMKALCTPEEWKGLSHFRTKKGLFNQLTQTPGSK